MAPMLESDAAMILPKGIVVNMPNVYRDVARLSTVPAEKAWEYWRIYTTTNKRLQDPTARRLENFWWHVIGSDRRHLSGPALARIYEDISLGPTFVPLRGPPNRWEGPTDPMRLQRVQAMLDAEQQQLAKNNVETRSTPDMQLKDIPSSALRPPPSHPILKKPSGLQSIGPRPTARFISPHLSEEETEGQDDIPSSGSTVTPGLEMPPVTIKSPPKKKASSAGRKFVASAGKRRPMMARRTSSHSAAGSADAGPARERTSSATVKSPRVPPQVASPVKEAFPALNNDLLPTPNVIPPTPSSKALGKRPAIPYTLPSNSKPEPSQQPPHEVVSLYESRTLPLPKVNGATAKQELQRERHSDKENAPNLGSPRASLLQQTAQKPLSSRVNRTSPPSLELSSQVLRERKQREPLIAHQPAGPLQPDAENHKPTRSDGSDISDSSTAVGSVRTTSSRTLSSLLRREGSFSQGLFTNPTASTTTIEVQGAIIDQSGNTSPLPITGQNDIRRFDADVPPSPSSILDSHLTPTPPSSARPVPLGRTRSQLNILLDRESGRAAKKGWARG